MDKRKQKKIFTPLFLLFIIINGACLFLRSWLAEKGIDHVVLLGANVILFILAMVSVSMFMRAINNPNPNVFVRNVIATVFIKLIVIAMSIIIYLLIAGENKSFYGIAAALGLYIIYTIIEVRGALTLNKKDGDS